MSSWKLLFALVAIVASSWTFSQETASTKDPAATEMTVEDLKTVRNGVVLATLGTDFPTANLPFDIVAIAATSSGNVMWTTKSRMIFMKKISAEQVKALEEILAKSESPGIKKFVERLKAPPKDEKRTRPSLMKPALLIETATSQATVLKLMLEFQEKGVRPRSLLSGLEKGGPDDQRAFMEFVARFNPHGFELIKIKITAYNFEMRWNDQVNCGIHYALHDADDKFRLAAIAYTDDLGALLESDQKVKETLTKIQAPDNSGK